MLSEYCIKEMIDKFLEGDRLCEDCKSEKRMALEKLNYDSVDEDGVKILKMLIFMKSSRYIKY